MAQAHPISRRRTGRGGLRPDAPPPAGDPIPFVPNDLPPVSDEASVTPDEPPGTASATPRRTRGSRGGRSRKKTPESISEPETETPPVPNPEVGLPKVRRASAKPGGGTKTARPRRVKRPEPPEAYDDSAPAAVRTTSAPAKARIPVTGEPKDVPAPFAHNAEYEFARILDFYGIAWEYEPRSFTLRWERGHVTEAFTPDFYLPDLDLYVELTTLKSGLTAEKNRKMRQIKELYPDTNIIMLKKRDYLRLLAKYGYGAISSSQVPDIDKVLIPATKLQTRIAELGEEISQDYTGKEPVLIGVLRGVLVFMADLMRQVSLSTSVDFMSVSSYDGNGSSAVRILKDIELNIKGKDVILVEDIVDTGMTLNHIIEYLQTKRPASIKVATLLDKRARRLVEVPIEYVGFEIPDEFVVGYGLDFHQRFRNLPFIGTLKHELLP